jgi:hypothetical protein
MKIEMAPTYILTPKEKQAIDTTIDIVNAICETAPFCGDCPFVHPSGTCGVSRELLYAFHKEAKVEEKIPKTT